MLGGVFARGGALCLCSGVGHGAGEGPLGVVCAAPDEHGGGARGGEERQLGGGGGGVVLVEGREACAAGFVAGHGAGADAVGVGGRGGGAVGGGVVAFAAGERDAGFRGGFGVGEGEAELG